ncbi:MAG: alpha/beta fold hydrolase [Thermomicrobiales bacterium]
MQFGNQNRRQLLHRSALASAGLALAGSTRSVNAQSNGATPEASPQSATLGDPTAREGQFAEVNGARIFYQVSGEGQPMLLLHGYPLSGALFSRNRDALAEQYMVITVDHRGYGQSEAPAVPGDVAVYAQDALSVLDELGVDQAIIGGHSMGGPITFEMYKSAPDRFRGMILIDTIAAPASTIEAALWGGFADEAEQNGISMIYVNALIKDMLSGDTRLNHPEQVTYLTEVVKQASVDGAIGGARALAGRPDNTGLLGQINVPTLVFVGVEDTIYPVSISQMMAKAIPNSQLAMIPGAAHAAIFEAPDQSTQAILDWAAGIE